MEFSTCFSMAGLGAKSQKALMKRRFFLDFLVSWSAIFLVGCGNFEGDGKPLAKKQSEASPAGISFANGNDASVSSAVQAPRRYRVAKIVSQSGCCDGSAGVALDAEHFLVANDEDSVLRVYSRHGSPRPLASVDFRKFLDLGNQNAESDIEGLARIGSTIYAVGSHSRSKAGKKRKERRRFFALRYSWQDGEIRLRPHGQPYDKLVEAFEESPLLREVDFERAKRKAGNRRDGLNIEGLVSTPKGGLLIGFRAPLLGNEALLVPLLNPAEVVAAKARPHFGPPERVDLDGTGIRGMARRGDSYLLAAESEDNLPKIFRWDGSARHPKRILVSLPNSLNTEAVLLFPDTEEIHLLSDDGNAKANGNDCNESRNSEQKRFRRVVLRAVDSEV